MVGTTVMSIICFAMAALPAEHHEHNDNRFCSAGYIGEQQKRAFNQMTISPVLALLDPRFETMHGLDQLTWSHPATETAGRRLSLNLSHTSLEQRAEINAD